MLRFIYLPLYYWIKKWNFTNGKIILDIIMTAKADLARNSHQLEGNVDQDQTARCIQSDFDIQYLQQQMLLIALGPKVCIELYIKTNFPSTCILFLYSN